MTFNSENSYIDTFIQSHKSHLKKFNKILTKSYTVHEQERLLKILLSNVKIDIKQYKKDFNLNQKNNCLNQFNDLVELKSKIKERCKILEKEIVKIELEEYDPYPYSNEYIDSDTLKKEVKEFVDSIKTKNEKDVSENISVTEDYETEKFQLSDFIYNIENKEEFLNDLKHSFKTEKGVEIRALIEILKKREIIIIGNRQFKKFIGLLEKYFKREIGRYQSINDAKNYDYHIPNMEKKLKPIILKYKQPK